MKIGEGHQFGINLEDVQCPKCKEPLPKLRVPDSLHQLMWGGWTCPKCGSQMDKWGKAVTKANDEG